MTGIATFIKGLIREVKKHMEAVIIAAAIFFMTLGFYTIFEQPQYEIMGAVGVVIGLIFWVVALFRAYKREQRERQERMEEREQHDARWLIERAESQQLLKAILTELKRFNQGKGSKEREE